jgi:hypothetical protein
LAKTFVVGKTIDSSLVFGVDVFGITKYLPDVLYKFLVLAGIGLVIAGAVLGAVLSRTHGILAEASGTILGGIAGLFVGLNAVRMGEVVVVTLWRMVRRFLAQKEAENVPKQKDDGT